MSQESENFEPLRRLLALKRHEQPPPGYFNDFSRQVILRIKAGERGEQANLIERLLAEAPWIQRLWQALEARPILAGACGVAVCGLMLTGVLYSDTSDIPQVVLVPPAGAVSAPGMMTSLSPSDQPLMGGASLVPEPAMTRPVLPVAMPQESILGDITKLPVERASFSFPGSN
jgi:hypothetical protein